MAVRIVPHRPARGRPPPLGPRWLAGVLPALSRLPDRALGASAPGRCTPPLTALLVVPAVGGTAGHGGRLAAALAELASAAVRRRGRAERGGGAIGAYRSPIR
jgi:hypothetical protein